MAAQQLAGQGFNKVINLSGGIKAWDGHEAYGRVDQGMPIFEEKMGAKTSREWLQLFEEAGIPCGPILDMEEVFASPHVEARDMMFSMPHPIEKEIPQLGFPYKFSDASPSVRRRPPLLGEHAELILGEEIGMQRADILKLIQDKVLFTPCRA